MNSIVKEKRYISEKLGVPYESLSQSYLRAETELLTTSKIDFTLQRNKATSTNVTERLLDLNDEFVITHFFVGLKGTDFSSTPIDGEHLTSTVQTYENPLGFPAASTNVGVVYNSNLNFTIDRTEFVPQFPVKAFRRVPFQQIDEYTNSEGDLIRVGKNGFTNGLYGFANSEPTLINGRQTLDLSIDLETSVTINDKSSSGKTIFAVFEARGYLVVNAK